MILHCSCAVGNLVALHQMFNSRYTAFKFAKHSVLRAEVNVEHLLAVFIHAALLTAEVENNIMTY